MDRFNSCLSFFTRLSTRPILGGRFYSGPLADCLTWLPLVGLIVGFIGMLAGWGASWFGAGAEAQALIVLVAMTLATGALHEDGLADCLDGFGGGMTKARKLEIMRDSRIGTYGVLAIVLVMALEFMLIAQLPLLALLGFAVVSRTSIAVAMHWGKPARKDGLAARAGKTNGQAVWINLTAAIVLALVFGGVQALVLAGVFGFAAYRLAVWQIGGLTGDVYGLLVKATGLGFLLGALG